jgi:hypothetical protein
MLFVGFLMSFDKREGIVVHVAQYTYLAFGIKG